ncbi:MAG: hypothetical protein WCO68_09905 [Verrucomicrobiota bacterium]
MMIAGALATAGAVFAQEPDPAAACCAMMPGMMGGMRGAHKAEMMQWHQKMMEKIKAQDAEMDKLVQEMNAASGDKKVDAIAAIVNKVMEERKAWHSEMEMRHKKMMEWMQAAKPTPESEKASPTPEAQKGKKSH